ncbi:MAG: TetR/AcrR family transcriptional regulator [bacterium]
MAELARKLGITHPAILHHFGTREALLESVVARALERRYAEVVTRLSAGDDALGTARGLLEAASRAFAREGTSRLVAWLALGSDPDRALGPPRSLAPVAEAVDAVRGVAGAGRRGRSSEASLFAVHLGALLLLGEPVLGPAIWTAQGRRCTPARERAFHDWFTQLLSNALLETAPDARRPAVRPRRR